MVNTLTVAVAIAAAGLAGPATLRPGLITDQAVQSPNTFLYAGEPVHPKLVEEFEGWLSDARPPITVAVDVAAAFGTNEYSEPVATTDSGLVRYTTDGGWYGYQHLGALSDGTHVLRTATNSGGSGVFMNLVFVRLETDLAVRPAGTKYKRTLMHNLGSFVLGDRDNGAIYVDDERVEVGASRYRALPTTLSFGR
jgi:hypothetical protein